MTKNKCTLSSYFFRHPLSPGSLSSRIEIRDSTITYKFSPQCFPRPTCDVLLIRQWGLHKRHPHDREGKNLLKSEQPEHKFYEDVVKSVKNPKIMWTSFMEFPVAGFYVICSGPLVLQNFIEGGQIPSRKMGRFTPCARTVCVLFGRKTKLELDIWPRWPAEMIFRCALSV